VEPTVGARIRAIRETAGLKSQELAELVGLDPTVMSKIETGKRAVKTVELARIADALRVSPLALLEEPTLLAELPIAARAAGQSITRGQAYAKLVAFTELHVVLHDAGVTGYGAVAEAPAANHDQWKSSAEELAEWASTKLGVTETGDERFGALAAAIETGLGVDVFVDSFEGDPLSGAAITDDAFPLVFVNSSHPTPRCLFTLAHELGHLLAHHERSITLDRELAGIDESERFANAFAACLLMPEQAVRSFVTQFGRGPESLLRMTEQFGVSFESLVFRLHNVGLINAAGRDQLRALGWRGLLSLADEPPLSEQLGPDVPTRLMSRTRTHPRKRPPIWLLRRCFDGHKKGVVSVRPLAGLIGADADELLDDIDKIEDIRELARDAFSFDNDFGGAGDVASDDEIYSGSPF